jgi:hypothetical protein
MRGMRKVMTTAGFLSLALLPLLAAVSPEAATSAFDALPAGQVQAIAQPLAAIDSRPLIGMPVNRSSNPMLPESGLLVLVGSALLGLATMVRRTRN